MEGRVAPVSALCMNPPTYCGGFPIRQDIKVIPADKPGKHKIGFRVKETIGMAVYNPAALASLRPEGTVWVTDEHVVGTGFDTDMPA